MTNNPPAQRPSITPLASAPVAPLAPFDADIVDRYLNGASIREIARQVGRCYSTVRNILVAANAPLRRAGRSPATPATGTTCAEAC